MKINTLYKVTKINMDSGNEHNMGTYEAKDVQEIVKGYKQDELIKHMYTRRGSHYFFVVEDVNDPVYMI